MSNWFSNWKRRRDTRQLLGTIGIRDVHYSTPVGDGWEYCSFCDTILRRLMGPESVRTPRGEYIVRQAIVGYVCLRCAIAAAGNDSFAPSQGWVPVEKFRP